MASYKYEIVGPDGKPKSGTIEAQNIEMLNCNPRFHTRYLG